jgi:hypothetical protein
MTRSFYTYLPIKMEQTECSETLAYKIRTPGNYPEVSIKHSEHGESSKSRIHILFAAVAWAVDFVVCLFHLYRQVGVE